MQPYRGLADIYDYLLAGVDYEEWADYLEQIFGYFRIKPCGIILDLACGTGNLPSLGQERLYRLWVDIFAR